MTRIDFVPLQEPDRIRARLVYAGWTGLLVLLVVAVIVTWLMTPSLAGWHTAPGATPAGGLPRIDQSMFGGTPAGLSDRRAAQQDLESYAWVDRDRGLVQMPISRAMDLVAREDHVH